MKRIILASQSPRRKELLEQIGMKFECVPSNVDEKICSDIPKEIVKNLANQKAEDVARMCKGEYDLIIGADTIVACDNRILGKPRDYDEAVEMIQLLSGRKHQVYTGVSLILPDKNIHFANCTDVFVNKMTKEQIESYVNSGESMDKAGAYGIQGRFAAYIERIEGDYNNVVGLPVAEIVKQLIDNERKDLLEGL